MNCIHGIQGVQTLALFWFWFKNLPARMPSASSPASSRVASLKRTHVLCCLLLEVRVGVAEGKGVWPIPVSTESRRECFHFLVRRILDGSGW